jgi:hypothetical protein
MPDDMLALRGSSSRQLECQGANNLNRYWNEHVSTHMRILRGRERGELPKYAYDQSCRGCTILPTLLRVSPGVHLTPCPAVSQAAARRRNTAPDRLNVVIWPMGLFIKLGISD